MGAEEYVRPGPRIPESARIAPPPAAPEPPPQPRAPPVDRRSPAQRLVDTRCGACHSAELYACTGRSRLGWELVVVRMRLVNGARLAPGERAVIVHHLTEHHGAPLARVVAEGAAAVALLGAAAGAGLWRRRRGRP